MRLQKKRRSYMRKHKKDIDELLKDCYILADESSYPAKGMNASKHYMILMRIKGEAVASYPALKGRLSFLPFYKKCKGADGKPFYIWKYEGYNEDGTPCSRQINTKESMKYLSLLIGFLEGFKETLSELRLK